MIDLIRYWFELLPDTGLHGHVNENLLILFSWGFALSIAVAALLLLLLSLVYKFFRKGKWLTIAFCIVWLCGFAVYEVGSYIEESRYSLFGNVPMSTIHAFEMFLFQGDLSAVHSYFHENTVYMCCFSVVHLLAAFVSLVFVLKHFGYNIIAHFKMLAEAYFWRTKQTTYVFWSMNDASYNLARDIRNHHERINDKSYRMIVVRTTNDDEMTGKPNGVDRLMNILSLKNIHLDRLLDLMCLTTNSFQDVIHLRLEGVKDDVLCKHLQLNALAAIIKRKTRGSVHMFFFSDDDNENILAVANLKRDQTVHSFADGAGHEVHLYCRARYNSVHRVIEDEQLHNCIQVHVVDASHISIEAIKQRVEFHPVNFVTIEKDATVSSAFNALVVGFGEVGTDAVRFLYEFGAFVKSGTGTKTVAVERSDFHCDVIDPSMSHLAGVFQANAPSVSVGREQSSLISLHEMDPDSADFFDFVKASIKKLNYVVIALDDDVKNISLAVLIFKFAVQHKEWRDGNDCLSDFRILVRVKRDNDGQIRRIAEHYNRLWAAEMRCEDKLKRIHQHEIKKSDRLDVPITIFGLLEETFTYDFIVDDTLTKVAKQYKKRYDQSVDAMTGSKSSTWETQYDELMQLTPDSIDFSPTLSGVMRLRRTQKQNFENCYHLKTKALLARRALGDELFPVFASGQLTRKENEITYSCIDGTKPDDAVTRVLDVIAQTEHLRWIASHELMGYKDYLTEDDKDEARLLHGCLKPWEELSPRVQSYDYNVVDVALDIHFKDSLSAKA